MKTARVVALAIVALSAITVAQPARAMTPAGAGLSLTRTLAIDAPEPASLSLLAVGGVALLLRRHRR